MNAEMKIIREVSSAAEMKIIREVSSAADDCYEDAMKLGNHAAEAIQVKHRSQMTGLENIADSTLKISDVYDYIKKQIARFSHWRQPFSEQKQNGQGFGERLLVYLEKDLGQKGDEICEKRLKIGNTSYEEKQQRRHIHLLLMRQFIRSMVVIYEYRVASGNGREEEE